MNNYPHLIEIDAPFSKELYKQVWQSVEKRFQLGPFVTSRGWKPAYRYVCVAKSPDNKLQIWENGGGLTPGPSVLFEYVTQAFPGITMTDVNQFHPGVSPNWWRILKRAYYALDTKLQPQLYNQFISSVPGWLSEMFPLVRDDNKARLDLISSKVEPPKEVYFLGCFSYQGYVKARLQLSVTLEQEVSPVIRKQTVTLANFPALTPDATFIYRGQQERYAVDEFSQELHSLLLLFTKELKSNLNNTALETLAALTPHRLYNKDT